MRTSPSRGGCRILLRQPSSAAWVRGAAGMCLWTCSGPSVWHRRKVCGHGILTRGAVLCRRSSGRRHLRKTDVKAAKRQCQCTRSSGAGCRARRAALIRGWCVSPRAKFSANQQPARGVPVRPLRRQRTTGTSTCRIVYTGKLFWPPRKAGPRCQPKIIQPGRSAAVKRDQNRAQKIAVPKWPH
jgi:hypothetical protein